MIYDFSTFQIEGLTETNLMEKPLQASFNTKSGF